MNADQVNRNLEKALSATLHAHGFAPFAYRGWLAICDGLPGFRASFDPRDDLQPSVCQVDFEVLTGPDGIIVESFAVPCETPERVAQTATDKFAASALHTILAGLCGDTKHSEQVDTERWTNRSDVSWQVYLGGWQLIGYEGQPTPPSIEVFDAVQTLATQQLTADRELHWCRVFHGNLGGCKVVEALWNNKAWDAGMRALELIDWRVARNQTSRCFFLFRKEAASAAG